MNRTESERDVPVCSLCTHTHAAKTNFICVTVKLFDRDVHLHSLKYFWPIKRRRVSRYSKRVEVQSKPFVHILWKGSP
jgi:hypothetical protein